MATARSTDDQLAEQAALAFRTFGYEGTSLKRLAEATGLEKASLYYRFPGGKDQILMASVARVGEWMEANILEPLRGEGTVKSRAETVAERLRGFYADGTYPCMLDTLSLSSNNCEVDAQIRDALRGALEAWLQAFADLAVEAGSSRAVALLRAERAVRDIEGGLVLSRVMGDSAIFLRSLDGLTATLTSVGEETQIGGKQSDSKGVQKSQPRRKASKRI